jgi:3-deoxy-D-manno-octulosonate 8-phosphate phosphatase (KDO 8-P phosphatase)
VTAFADVALVAFDIDGTLTDASTWWAGESVGWVQRYSVRDGEAILRMRQRIPIVPVSRNQTASARERVRLLGLDARWLGVTNKIEALGQVCREYLVEPQRVCFVGDGIDDVEVFAAVGLGCAVADAHPRAIAAARVVLQSRGGERVMEELERRLEAAA